MMTIYANLGVGWVLIWGILEKEKDALRERDPASQLYTGLLLVLTSLLSR